MMWTKLTIDTTVEAVDLISAFLDEKGVEGVMIEDHVPLTEEDRLLCLWISRWLMAWMMERQRFPAT